jgi:hypothetical protein
MGIRYADSVQEDLTTGNPLFNVLFRYYTVHRHHIMPDGTAFLIDVLWSCSARMMTRYCTVEAKP